MEITDFNSWMNPKKNKSIQDTSELSLWKIKFMKTKGRFKKWSEIRDIIG